MNRIVVPTRQATLAVETNFLDSIPGLLISLKFGLWLGQPEKRQEMRVFVFGIRSMGRYRIGSLG
jgi:hypothetical protein